MTITRRWQIDTSVRRATMHSARWDHSGGIYAARELMVLGFVKQPRGMKLLERVATRHRAGTLKDPELIEQTTPRYTVG
jgi:hypothetical protein